MKNESKKGILSAVKSVALKENKKAVEDWPPCSILLYQPKRKNK